MTVAPLQPKRTESSPDDPRSGQSMIEASLMMALLSFILFGIFQISQIYASKEIMMNASVAGARARTVGLNEFMVYKVVRASTIPNAGKIQHPSDVPTSTLDMQQWMSQRPGEAYDNSLSAYPRSAQSAVERSLIPLYLGGEHWAELPGILEYQDWDTVGWPYINDDGVDILSVRVFQDLPLRYPFHRAFVDSEFLTIDGDGRMDNHYPLYLK